MDSTKNLTIKISDLSNGASLAIALYSQGVDITEKSIAQTFHSVIPFSDCMKIARDTIGVDKQTVIRMMQVMERASRVFSETWKQGVDAGLDKKVITANAQAASNEIKTQGIAGLNIPAKVSPKGINPLPTAKASPIVQFTESLLFKFDSVGYRVGKKSIKGVYRVTLQNKNTKHPLEKLEGQTVDLGMYGTFRVLKTGDTYANLEPMDPPASVTPTTPAVVKTDSPAVTPNAELIAQVTAAVIAALNAK